MGQFNAGSALSGAAQGAALGTALFPGVGTAAGALVGLAPSLFKLFSGASQRNKANQINPTNPGYQVNQGVLDNARILSDRYNNYTLPGQTQAQTNINNNIDNAYSAGVQGATSGADVADLAAKLAYQKNVATQNLAAQTAQGKENLLPQYLEANAAAGQEFQNKNAYDRQQYQEQLRQKAALTQAGATNEYNGLDTGASVLSAYLNPKAVTTDISNQNVGKGKPLGSIFDTPSAPYSSTASVDPSIDWSKLYQRYQLTNPQ